MAMLEPEEKKTAAAHHLILENRKALTATGVSNVDSFNEQMIVAYTSLGELTIIGEGLHISRLDMETGELSVDGEISSMSYSESSGKEGTGFFSRLFR